MEFSSFVERLRRKWLAVLALTAVPALIAGVVSGMMPAKYTASASAAVVPFAVSGGRAATLAEARQLAATYTANAMNRAVALRVIQDLGLTSTEEALRQNITAIRPQGQDSLIRIEATSGSPEEAAKLADAYVKNLATIIAGIQTPAAPGVQVQPAASALVPTYPSSPRTDLNVALAALIGGLAGFGFAAWPTRQAPRRPAVPARRRGMGSTASRLTSSPTNSE